jgi:hypothetical protein
MAGEIDRDKVKYFVDGSGPNGQFREGDDLREEVREVLGDYLSCLTKEERNKFTIRPGSNKTTLKEPIRPDAPGSENAFAKNDPNLSRYSDTGQIFTPSVNDFIKKGTDGHDVLKNIDPGPGTNRSGKNTSGVVRDPIVKQVSSVISNNRFNPRTNPFVSLNEAPDVVAGVQTRFGQYDPAGTDIKFSDMEKVGRSLALRAVGEFIEGDPDSFKVAAGALIPGEAQLGATKLAPADMYAKNVFGAPEKIQVDGTITVDKGRGSYGQLNSFAEPFDGFMPIGMTLLGVILVIALRLVVSGLLFILGLIVKPNTDTNTVPSHGPFIAGQYGRPDPANGLVTLRDLGINATENDFLTSVDLGLDVFFEFSGNDVLRVVQAPGFYVNFVRSIIRSGNTVVGAVSDAFSAGNPVAVAQSILGVVEVIKSSKIISFLNTMATLGDRALAIKSLNFEPNGKDRIISIQNRIKENGASRVMKSRVDNNKLAWRNSSSPSKYLIPDEVLVADSILLGGGGNNVLGGVAGLGDKAATKKDVVNNRIKPEVVKEIEDELEAEYVPFYFHDLRTGEIVSFHAFLSSLEDSYSANYESTNAYGRIEPIRTYSNTERSLTVSFTIAATSKSDFDEMWWKINMLSMYMYPQWSQGRQVLGKTDTLGLGFSSDTKFIQPFSQIPTASPMIRMRIGDVVRSNYSKFGLARLFGFGSEKNDIVNISTKIKEVDLIRRKVALDKKRMMTDPFNSESDEMFVGYMVRDRAMLIPKFEGYIEPVKASLGKIPSVRNSASDVRKLKLSAATKVEIKKGPLIGSYGEHTVTTYVVEVVDTEANEQKGEWLCTHQDLYPAVDDLALKARGKDPSSFEDSLTADLNYTKLFTGQGFLSEDSNSIVRSFNSTRGRGLAGFITSLNFTELAQAQWETMEYGSRAPKLVKVNISFAPVHDIAPGIDHTGFNRAPIYPVGNVAKGIGGDVYEDEGGRTSFEQQHADVSGRMGKKP